MKIAIQLFGVLLLLQVAMHVVLYFIGGMTDGITGLGKILDADLVRLTVGLIAIFVTRK